MFVIQTVCNIDSVELLYYACDVRDHDAALLYKAFGKMVRLHRERQSDLTQEKLGGRVGLSRGTSITRSRRGGTRRPASDLCHCRRTERAAGKLLPKLGGDGSRPGCLTNYPLAPTNRSLNGRRR